MQFLKNYFGSVGIAAGRNNLSEATAEEQPEGFLFSHLTTKNCQLTTIVSGSPLPIIRRRSNAHAAEFVAIVLLEEHIPLFAALEDFFLLRRNLLADFQLHFLFILQRSRQDQHDLLPDRVPVINEFDVVARNQHFGDLVGQSHDLFPAKSHPSSSPSICASTPAAASHLSNF